MLPPEVIMSDEPAPQQLRAIPLEAMRTFALTEAGRTSLRVLAERVGVGRTTLRGFLYDDRKPHPRVRRLLAMWYVREAGAVEVDACETLLLALPADRRHDALAELRVFLVEWRRTYGGG